MAGSRPGDHENRQCGVRGSGFDQSVQMASRNHPPILDLAREATALGCLPEAKIWLKCALHLEGSVRKSALRDLRLKPLWKWIEATP
jgi:hypothetical protein